MDEARSSTKSTGLIRILRWSALASAGTFLLICWPELTDKGHIFEDLCYSWAVVAVCLPPTILMTLYIMFRSGQAKWAFPALMAVGIVVSALIFGEDYFQASKLVVNGVSSQGRIIRLFDRSCGRDGRCQVEVKYTFTPIGKNVPVIGFDSISDKNIGHNYYDSQEKSDGIIPTIYDRDDPSRSTLSDRDLLIMRGTLKHFFWAFSIFGGVIVLGLSPMALIFWPRVRKQAGQF